MSAVHVMQSVLARWKVALTDTVAATAAALLAWQLSVTLFGHTHPVFAAVAAIVCLSPGLPSHARQAVGMMLGVTLGIVVGELALLLPVELSLLRVGVASFASMLLAASFGMAPVVAIQAGVSAVLVLAIGPATAGAVRLIDVIVGTAVGLVFSQALFTPDPVQPIRAALQSLLRAVGGALTDAADAVSTRDANALAAALRALGAAHDRLIELQGAVAQAQDQARWSIRGRFAAPVVRVLATVVPPQAATLHGAAQTLGSALQHGLRTAPAAAPAELADALRAAAGRCVLPVPVASAARTRPTAAPAWSAAWTALDLFNEALNEIAPLQFNADQRRTR